MKKIFSMFIIFNLFIGCSFIESKSFYETFINPNLDIEINDHDSGPAPELESVPESNRLNE